MGSRVNAGSGFVRAPRAFPALFFNPGPISQMRKQRPRGGRRECSRAERSREQSRTQLSKLLFPKMWAQDRSSLAEDHSRKAVEKQREGISE